MSKKFDFSERGNLVEEVADYFIQNNSSTRKTAKHFDIGNSTVYDYLTSKLPTKNMKKYILAMDILHNNVAKTKYGNDIQKRVNDIYNCLVNDMTIQQISDELGISKETIYKDIPKMDKEKLYEVKSILGRHSIENSPFIK